MCSFAYADFPGELPVSYGRCDGPFIRLSAARLRVCRRCELRWHLFVLELIYVMLELFTTRFFSKPVAMSKPDTPVCCALCNYVGEAVRYAGPPGPRWRSRHELPLILPVPSNFTVRGIAACHTVQFFFLSTISIASQLSAITNNLPLFVRIR